MTTLTEFMILSGVDNRPPIRAWKNEELSATEKIQADCDLKATNIILQGLPSNVYSLVNHHRFAKDLWERIQLLMQGTSLTKQERECKLYDAFDKFAHIKGESLHQYYLRFTQLINDMNIYKIKLEQFQVNTKFLNSLPPEWSKFVTDVKLVKDLHTTNFDQFNAYLEQHELHANEVRIMRERSQDPLALVANHQMTPSHFNTYQSSYNNPRFQQQFSPSQSPQYGSIHPTQHYSTTYPSTPLAITYPSAPYPNAYSSTVHQDAYFGLAIPVFKQGDDPIDAINKMMSFLSTVVTSRFPSTNNQQINSSNPRQQATILDGRVTVQPVQRRQSSFAAGTSGTRANISRTGGNNSAQQRVVKCFNCQGEAKAILMANLSSYRSDVLSRVLLLENTHNDMLNQSVQEIPYSEQTYLMNYPETLFGPSIHEDGVTRLKEYVALTLVEAIQADCDIKAINIISSCLPTEVYALVSQHRVEKIFGKIKC
ncbi:hypothetical protein Tco_1404513 [Tanacetum coccineum]